MKNYLASLQEILDEGYSHPDRTGVGRRSIFGKTLKFDLSQGFPIPTTRHIPFRSVVNELLWFIRGAPSAKDLKEAGVSIWEPWTVKPEHVDAFISKHRHDIEDEQLNDIREAYYQAHIGSIGPMYGTVWRYLPVTEYSILSPPVTEDMIASDKLAMYRQYYAEEVFRDEQGQVIELSWMEFLHHTYHSSIDQLQQLIVSLRDRPYSSRHILSAWVPSLIPFETLSPHENVLLGKGALAPCHILVQCFVKEIEGKRYLSLILYQRGH